MADSEAYLEALPDAVVVVDAEGQIAYANAAAERLARAGRDELAGRQLDEPARIACASRSWPPCRSALKQRAAFATLSAARASSATLAASSSPFIDFP